MKFAVWLWQGRGSAVWEEKQPDAGVGVNAMEPGAVIKESIEFQHVTNPETWRKNDGAHCHHRCWRG